MNELATILIVDDHAANRDALTGLLENPSYQLVEATDGPEALKLAEAGPPDLILLDVMMPGMDGFEVCRRLRANPRLAEVPVIMITALDDRQSRLMGISCGADDFISKPFDQGELRTRVRTITRLNRYGRLLRERTKVEEANQKIREQAALIDLATDAIVTLDLDGRVQSWNPGAEKVFGTSAADACGRPLASLISKGDSARLDKALVEAQQDGEWRGDLLAFRPGGDNVIAHSHWTLLRHADGLARGVLTVSSDVTEFKKLQAQFYRAQRMESLGALAGGIAHDLNNMLSPVLIAAEVLQTNPPAEVQQAMAHTIQTCAERGAGMVRQILAFARGSDGAKHTEIQPGHLARDIVRLAQETFPKTITINSQANTELNLIQGDPTQIHQVLLNLLVNARDAITGGGTITVAAENRILDATFAAQIPGVKAGPYVMLQVTDNGCGMTPEVLAKIWNPFFTTKPPGKGSGIGLSTVRNIIKEHAGFVDVTSQPGQGTTFSIFIPTSGGTAPDAMPATPTRLPLGHGERVLVVDDEVALAQMTRTLLAEHNYLVAVADGPAAALGAFRQGGHYDLVLVDFDMPMMDGVRLTQALRNIKSDLRAILVTGSQEIQTGHDLTGRFAAVISKPFTAETLLVAMDRALHADGRASGGS